MHAIVNALEVSPVIDWSGLAPLLVVMGAAVLGVLVEALPWASLRRTLNAVLMLVALVVSLFLVVLRFLNYKDMSLLGVGSFLETRTTLLFQAVLLVMALLSALVVLDRSNSADGSFIPQAADGPGSAQEDYALKINYQRTEVYILMLFSVAGMMAFISAANLLVLFVALEVMSLPLYVMSATGRRRRLLSQEAGFKYFLQGAYASAFFLMGIAMLYGYSGSLYILSDGSGATGVANALMSKAGLDWMALIGFTMLLIGLFFKVGAVPFHAWTPDVYQGAPSPISGFMAAGVKVAAFGALLNISTFTFSLLSWDLVVMMWFIIIATIAVGTYMGIVQTDIKRMLAYSSVAHVGFILIALLNVEMAGFNGVDCAILFYVLSYGIATIGAFALVSIVRDTDAEGTVRGEASDLAAWNGFGRSHPALAGAMAVFLLSFAGIPLTGGFIGKFVVFAEGIKAGGAVLVLIGLLASIVTAYFYFRVIQRMFFTDPGEDAATVPAGDTVTKCVVICCAIATIALGICSGPVLGLLAPVA